MECKKALQESNGDLEAAVDYLRSRGVAKAAKRSDKSADEGTIGVYIHHGGRIGVMVEINCETDFVANTEAFQQLARDIAMHVAAANPLAVSTADLDQAVVERERAVYVEQVRNEGKPEAMIEKIVEGKMRRFYQESTLLEQNFVRDPERTITQLITDVSAKTGEKIEVARFSRFAVGTRG